MPFTIIRFILVAVAETIIIILIGDYIMNHKSEDWDYKIKIFIFTLVLIVVELILGLFEYGFTINAIMKF